MKAKLTHYISVGAGLTAWIAALAGCTTAEVSPQGPLPALPPPYVQVPHPAGYSISDLRAIFTAVGAPSLVDLKNCDADFKKLRTATQAADELAQGARELVRQDPVKYHWCYYGMVLQLEETLKSESYLDEKQKSVLDVYSTLTPLARAYMQEFHDSRYMRWGVNHYRQVSAWIFYRKVEMTPQSTSELVEASNPFGLLKEATPTLPVLEKYGIARPPQPVPLPPPAATAASVPPTMPATEPVVPAPTSPPATEVAASTAAPVTSPEPLPAASTLTSTPGATASTEFQAPPPTTVEAPTPPASTEVVTTPAVAEPVAEPVARAPAAAPVAEEPPLLDGSADAILQGDSVVPTSN